MREPSHERRRAGRPSNGDIAICNVCGRGTLEFSERTRDAGTSHTAPAWACDRCGAIQAVRGAGGRPPVVPYAEKRRRARSVRTLMKSRTKKPKAS